MANSTIMQVVKRNGSSENVSFDKILTRITALRDIPGYELSQQIDPSVICMNTIRSMKDGITTTELDTESAKIASNMVIHHYDYGVLGARIAISNLRKNLTTKHNISNFSEMTELIAKKLPGFLNEEYYNFVSNNKVQLNGIIMNEYDYNMDYFGYRTLEYGYLIKNRTNDIDEILETPQALLLRVSIAIHMPDIDMIEKNYHQMAQGKFTHATPTLFNAGTKVQQMSSCYLLGTHDSLEGIFKTITDCGKISKWAGGIGIHISNIRGRGQLIKSTNGQSEGIIPMLRLYNETGKFINQCFTPDTWVYSSKGPKYVCDVTTKDNLITIDGTFKQVNQIITNKISKEILEIRTTNSLFPTKVTKEHQIYVLKNQTKTTSYTKIKNKLDKQLITPEYISADELTENEIVGYPIPQQINDVTIDDLDYFMFYGMMVGDGNICENKNECEITLEVDKKSELIDFVMHYLEKHNIYTWSTNTSKNCISIKWYNSPKLQLTHNMLYDDNNEKNIYCQFLHLPHNKTLKILEGLMKTNGSNLKELMFYTSSLKLLMQMRYILLRLGVLTSGYIKDNIVKSHVTEHGDTITTKKLAYNMRIPKHPVLSSILSFKSEFMKYFEYNGTLWGRIKSINKINYDGIVYDFNMIDNHNYLTDMGLVHNSGKRNGAIAIYLEPWCLDVLDFLEIRKNGGDESIKSRDLFTALWIPDYFMELAKTDEWWYLMSEDECPGLTDAYGDDFTKLYKKYVAEGKYKHKVKAAELLNRAIVSQTETGTPYIMYKDNVNRKSNHKNLGTVRSSNLCAEIVEYSDHETYAVCNLASIAVNQFYNKDKNTYDYDGLYKIAKQVTLNLNKIIDLNYYPTPETHKSNMSTRPIGVGVQGFGDLFMNMKIPYESTEAVKMSAFIMETIYFGCCEMSCELAEKFGHYEKYNGSPFSNGQLQYDLWLAENKQSAARVITSGQWDWKGLKESIKKYGMRNSMLTALMPTASTSQILGNMECFEPITSNIYSRKVLSGTFLLANKYLQTDLIERGQWTEEIRTEIMKNRGSVQNIATIPDELKQIYKTMWEIKQRYVIDHALARGPYVDQSQSMNLYFADSEMIKIRSALFYGWSNGLKTGTYYLRTRPSIEAQQQIVTKKTNENKPYECTMCSA